MEKGFPLWFIRSNQRWYSQQLSRYLRQTMRSTSFTAIFGERHQKLRTTRLFYLLLLAEEVSKVEK